MPVWFPGEQKRPLTCCRWWCAISGWVSATGPSPLVPQLRGTIQAEWSPCPMPATMATGPTVHSAGLALPRKLCPFAIFSTPRPRRALETVTVLSPFTEEETETQKFKA